MKHSYNIAVMTCDNCAAKIKNAILKLPEVMSAEIDRNASSVVIDMSKHIPLIELQGAIGMQGKYSISHV
ncbi:hypothetical protein BH11BAC1_BH11BAC1_09500 [soil metagenome]